MSETINAIWKSIYPAFAVSIVAGLFSLYNSNMSMQKDMEFLKNKMTKLEEIIKANEDATKNLHEIFLKKEEFYQKLLVSYQDRLQAPQSTQSVTQP